jgi:hypothetical protein
VRVTCPNCKSAELKLLASAFFSRRTVLTCTQCGQKTKSEPGRIVGIKNLVVGVLDTGLMMALFIFLWSKWLLVACFFATLFALDMSIMATLHKRNIRNQG